MGNNYIGMLCPFCKCVLQEQDEIVTCSKCEMPHHKECWIENQGCTTFGCDGTINAAGSAADNQTVQIDLYGDSSTANNSGNSAVGGTICPNCGSHVEEGDRFCVKCGSEMKTSGSFCAKCGNPLSEDSRFCVKCGAEVKVKEQFCATCGNKINKDDMFCMKCGSPVPKADAMTSAYTAQPYAFNPTVPNNISADIQQNKGMAVLCYFGILLLIPLLTRKGSAFIRFHANQGLICLIIGLIAGVLGNIPIIGMISSLVMIFLVVVEILGIVNCCKGEMKELPLIGKFKILK